MKKRYIAVLYFAALACAGSAFANPSQNLASIQKAANQALSKVPPHGYQISADQLLKIIQSKKNNFTIVDVRESLKKYQAGHIPGAIYINFKTIAQPKQLAKLSRDKDIILYCNTGAEENKALIVLRMLGYRAYGLKFGYASWKKAKPTKMILSALKNADEKNYPVAR